MKEKKKSDLIGTFWKSDFNNNGVHLVVGLDGNYPIYLSKSGKILTSSVHWYDWITHKFHRSLI